MGSSFANLHKVTVTPEELNARLYVDDAEFFAREIPNIHSQEMACSSKFLHNAMRSFAFKTAFLYINYYKERLPPEVLFCKDVFGNNVLNTLADSFYCYCKTTISSIEEENSGKPLVILGKLEIVRRNYNIVLRFANSLAGMGVDHLQPSSITGLSPCSIRTKAKLLIKCCQYRNEERYREIANSYTEEDFLPATKRARTLD